MNTYSGKAKIVKIEAKELAEFQCRGLTEEEAADGMNIIVRVKPNDENYAECEIEIEFSAREGQGTMAGKKQSDISLQKMASAGIISKPDIECMVSEFLPDEDGNGGAIGKEIEVYQKEDSYTAKNGPNKGKVVNRVRTYISNGSNRLAQSEISKRIAKLRKAPAASSNANPFD